MFARNVIVKGKTIYLDIELDDVDIDNLSDFPTLENIELDYDEDLIDEMMYESNIDREFSIMSAFADDDYRDRLLVSAGERYRMLSNMSSSDKDVLRLLVKEMGE